MKTDILNIFSNLSQREKDIIINRFGLGMTEAKTLSQLGDLMGYSKERIRQLEAMALKKMRKNSKTVHFADYIEN